jgi:hypothetical protein
MWCLLWLAATAGIAACVTRPVTIVVPPPSPVIEPEFTYPIHTYQRT